MASIALFVVDPKWARTDFDGEPDTRTPLPSIWLLGQTIRSGATRAVAVRRPARRGSFDVVRRVGAPAS